MEGVSVVVGSISFIILSFVTYLFSKVFLFWGERGSRPNLFYKGQSPFVKKLLQECTLLTERYCPTLLWGWFGQLQTLAYGFVGRFRLKTIIKGARCTVNMSDGTTMTYDVFEPEAFQGVTVLVCPGITNHSECLYIQSLVLQAHNAGHRVAVLNHTGALNSVPLTAPRVFTYGGTGEFSAMYESLKSKFKDTYFAAVGLSMGANIVLRFFGELPARQKEFLCAVSVCQGYDPAAAMKYFHQWEKIRLLYNKHITSKMKQLIYHHGDTVLHQSHKRRTLVGDIYACHGERDCNGIHRSWSEPVDVEGLDRSTSIVELDEAYSRRVLGFSTVKEMYQWFACAPLLKNIVDFPVLLVNAKDDPLVDKTLHSIPRDHATSVNSKAVFVLTEEGGHLGFYEGGILIPNAVTWMDRLIVQYIDTVRNIHKKF